MHTKESPAVVSLMQPPYSAEQQGPVWCVTVSPRALCARVAVRRRSAENNAPILNIGMRAIALS